MKKLLFLLLFSATSWANEYQVMDTMQVCLVPRERIELAKQVGAVGNAYFRKPEARQWWYILLCMESKFNPKAGPSSAGAIGIGQIMPAFAEEFAQACNLPAPSEEDLFTLDVGLKVSACRFKELLKKYDNHPLMALAAYNAGTSSSAVKRVRNGEVRNMNTETLGYIAQASLLFENIKRLPAVRDVKNFLDIPTGFCYINQIEERGELWPYLGY